MSVNLIILIDSFVRPENGLYENSADGFFRTVLETIRKKVWCSQKLEETWNNSKKSMMMMFKDKLIF